MPKKRMYAGTTDFNVRDRVAIFNLLRRLTIYFDNLDVESYANCYTEDGKFIREFGPKIETDDEAERNRLIALKKIERKWMEIPANTMVEFFTNRLKNFSARGTQRRHIGTGYSIDYQDENRAVAVFYVLLTSIQNHVDLAFESTGFYTAHLVKKGKNWKIHTLHNIRDRLFAPYDYFLTPGNLDTLSTDEMTELVQLIAEKKAAKGKATQKANNAAKEATHDDNVTCFIK